MTKNKLKSHDKYIVVNQDPDLNTVILSLPKPPPLHLIDGYDLPVEKQRFKRLSIPHKLEYLEKEALELTRQRLATNKHNIVTLLKVQKTFWEELGNRRKEMKREIEFIRKVWWHRINGYWFFNRGKPTYITGKHFYYLNFFHMDTKSGFAEYRDCDRREYIFMEYAWTSTETFAKYDKDGNAMKNEKGKYDMIDLGRRICLGTGQSKNRRRGNTSKAISDGFEVITRTNGTDGFGIQSYSEENAKAHFKQKVLPAWNALPMWLKPYSTTGSDGDTLKFDVAKNDFGIQGLGTQIGYAQTSSPKAFDGKKYAVILTDEEGKELTSGSVAKRWEVNKHTLAQGDGMVIHGFSYHPSTADQQAAGAFDYYYLIQSSNFYRRIPVKGQTLSGLFRIFIPAQDGLEGFIDSYGYSVTGEVQDYQKKEGFTKTAEEYLQAERDILTADGSIESMIKLREHKKLYPMRFSDSWLGTAGDIGFDIEKIDARTAELKRDSETIYGNLEWIGGKFLGDVMFVEDEINGRFVVSRMPPDNIMNKKTWVKFYNAFTERVEDHMRPMYPGKFTTGADPFKVGGKGERKALDALGKKSRLSDGGICVLWNYDEDLDGGKPLSEAESYCFTVTYRNRLSNTDLYNEDLAKCLIWTGSMCYPETNVMNTYEYLVKNGMGGYLLYDVNPVTGKLNDKPGADTGEKVKQDIFQLWRDYIDYRCHKEKHLELLNELREITGIEFMRYFDLIAAGGMALRGAKSPYVKKLSNIGTRSVSLNDFIG